MKEAQSLEEFYKEKHLWMPDNIRNNVGHFNVFRLEPYIGEHAKTVPYRKRDYYKISLIVGNTRIHYADKIENISRCALVFSDPNIPYSWENMERISGGYFCVFNQHFYSQYGNLSNYKVYQPGAKHVYELTEEQELKVKSIFENMFTEISSEYTYKYDVLRNMALDLLHIAMKSEQHISAEEQPINASTRIATLFLELLERQFPIDDASQRILLRSASEFAQQLNIHVNHLNRAVKQITEKTTTQLIANRVLQESQILLKHSNWTVAEIAYALGFTEPTHFNNFFKKHTHISPLQYRHV